VPPGSSLVCAAQSCQPAPPSPGSGRGGLAEVTRRCVGRSAARCREPGPTLSPTSQRRRNSSAGGGLAVPVDAWMYRPPLRLSVGQRVTVQDTRWPAFVFVTAEAGQGWVPSRHLDRRSGIGRCDGDRALRHGGGVVLRRRVLAASKRTHASPSLPRSDGACVPPAHPPRRDTHQHLPWAGVGDRHVTQHGRLLPFDQPIRPRPPFPPDVAVGVDV
jgi:hypothetical protein